MQNMSGASTQLLKATTPNDLRIFSYAEWIAGDYLEFVKAVVMPLFKNSYGLKLREIRVLSTISIAGRNITASEIAEFLRQDPATVTRCMVVLIGKGFVESSENFSDGRSRILSITESGRKAADKFLNLFGNAVSTYDDSLQFRRGVGETEEDVMRILDSVTLRAMDMRDAKREVMHILKEKGSE